MVLSGTNGRYSSPHGAVYDDTLFSRAQRVREVPLTVADRTDVEKCRRNHNRLRFSYQVGD